MKEMTAPVEVDKQYRVTIPPAIRKRLGIERGEIIEIVVRKMDTTAMAKSESENPLEGLALALA
jgi:AbrB family looped-hinge helix DNA binding protein